MVRTLMITVDVEARPARAERDHVKRLIWGEYPEGRGGIGEMMDMGDRHGVRIVMYVDYCERALYGDDILDVGREIARRGHDLQLHSHPEFLPETFWSRRKLTRPPITNTASDAQADALFDYLCESQTLAGGAAPEGYRGGGYRYGPAVLRSLVRHGVMMNSSYIAARENQPLKRGRITQFYWDNGCLEVPVSCINPYLNLTRDFDLNFNASAFTTTERMLQCLENFYQQQGDDAVAVMVMHSWSFSKRQEDGFFSPPMPQYLQRFDEFLALLRKRGIEVVTTSEVLQLAKSGSIRVGDMVPIAALDMPQPSTAPVIENKSLRSTLGDAIQGLKNKVSRPVKPEIEGDKSMAACNVCNTPLSKFEDYNGRPKSRCPTCGSVERQRVFVEVYDRFIKHEFDLSKKRILAIAPSNAERMIFGERGITQVVSCDIQPGLKTDIVADIMAMPQIETASFDGVIASYVLTCVQDLGKALHEMHRILKPSGRFLFCDPVTLNAETVENTDIDVITKWYGKENYDRYRIGSFRRLGDSGILKDLAAAGFQAKTFYGRDPITQTNWIWHSATAIAEEVRSANLAAIAESCWKNGALEEAVKLHQLAITEKPQAISIYRLGTAHFDGRGIERNLATAWRFLSDRTQINDRYAAYFRGMIHLDEQSPVYDREKGVAELRFASDRGVAAATAILTKISSSAP